MKNHLLLSVMGLWLALAGCNNKPASSAQTVTAMQAGDTTSATAFADAYVSTPTFDGDYVLTTTFYGDYVTENDTFSTLDEYADMYLVVVDTGTNYWQLEHTMFTLNSKLGLKIDTMNRHYNKASNMVVLADDDEDDIWRGEYYPRRGGEDFLSIEYWQYFDLNENKHTDTTFALVAGMFDNTLNADSMAGIIKPYQPTVFVMKSNIYMGCMH